MYTVVWKPIAFYIHILTIYTVLSGPILQLIFLSFFQETMASSISKLKIAVGNYIHKKPVTHSQHHSSDKENIIEACQNTTVSDGKIKKSASFKRTKHNIPSSLIELTIEDKQRLKHNLMMMHLHDYNLLWRFFIEELCFYTIQGHHDSRQTKIKAQPYDDASMGAQLVMNFHRKKIMFLLLKKNSNKNWCL